MDQRALSIMILLFVLIGMGGFIAYDITSNNRFGKITGQEEQKSNWDWNDNWTADKNPVVPPVTPRQPDQEKPQQDQKQQIVTKDYQEAVKKSGELGMPVLAFFEADWCKWCNKMKNEVMTDQKVKVVLKNYILLLVDADTQSSLNRKFGVRGLPSYIVTNVNEQSLKKGQGYMDANKFYSWLNEQNLFRQPKKSNPQPQQPQPQQPRRRT